MDLNRVYFSLLIIVSTLVGCNNEMQDEKKCGLNIAITLNHVNDLGLRKVLVRSVNKEDSVFVSELIEILDSFGFLINDIFASHGNIDSASGILVGGCNSGIDISSNYKNSKVSTLVEQLNLLKTRYPSQKEVDLIEVLIQVVEIDIKDGNSIFNSSSDFLYSDIIISIAILQNKMYVLILDKYCIV